MQQRRIFSTFGRPVCPVGFASDAVPCASCCLRSRGSPPLISPRPYPAFRLTASRTQKYCGHFLSPLPFRLRPNRVNLPAPKRPFLFPSPDLLFPGDESDVRLFLHVWLGDGEAPRLRGQRCGRQRHSRQPPGLGLAINASHRLGDGRT